MLRPFQYVSASAALVLSFGLLGLGLKPAAADPQLPPYPASMCHRITPSDYETLRAQTPGYGKDFGYITHDPAKPGVDYYWKCNGMQVEAYLQEQWSGGFMRYAGLNAGVGVSGVTGLNKTNEVALTGDPGNRMSSTNTTAGGTVMVDFLFPVGSSPLPSSSSPPPALLIGPYGMANFFQQNNSFQFPAAGIEVKTRATDNFSGGIKIATAFSETGTMVYMVIGGVAERQNFVFTAPGAVTSESANVFGLQTGFGAAFPTSIPGVSIFGQVVGNYYEQHTFAGGPASPFFRYPDQRIEAIATLGVWIDSNGAEHMLHTP
jgi:hypothetical protein